MASEPDEPGPSGLTRHQSLQLLGLQMSSDDEADYHELMDRFERQRAFQTHLLEQNGGGLDPRAEGAFEFDVESYVDQRSTRMGVHERHFNTQLRQRGNLIPGQNITQALQDALRRAVNQVLDTTPDLHDQDRLYFTIGSNRLHNNFQGWGLRAGEWRQDTERVEALFHRLAQALNSNEQFEMDDSFQLSITQVQHAPQGTGRPRRGKPGHPTHQALTVNKRSVIQIKYNDDLCCARALVTAKARVDQHPKEKAIRQGRQLQRELALRLHDEARVPPGPCSYDALTAFSQAPSLRGYQIILVDAHRSYHITTYGDPQDKQLILLHDHNHYDVITRLPGFFGSSYVCAHCWKPYDHEGQHRCNKKKQCRACCQKECPDFQAAYPRKQKATQRCQQCRRDFFGDTCLQAHVGQDHTGKPAAHQESSVCFTRRRCPTCFKLNVGLQEIARHQCYYVDCPSCHEYVHSQNHFCFIQRPTQDKKRKRKHQGGPRAKRGAAAAAEPDTTTPEEDDDLPPLHVFFDIEAMQPHQQHIANLLVAETEDHDEPKPFPGPSCTRDFLEWLDTLTLNDTRQVNVLAHNFQGYDGYFVVQQYHSDNRIVQQLRNGCKLLEVKHDRIRFIDSISFFQMPLSAFPKTFGLTELKKGYFPHKFNIPDDEHQTYVGPVPAPDYYMPETMSPEDRQAFEKWHQEQNDQGVVFNFQKELLAYCKSDVRLLKEGCLTFKRMFEAQAGFNPFDHITIASACSMDLRMNRMIPNSTASEPTLSWKKNNINQSYEAIEWLTWCQQHQAPHLQHAKNTGEYRIPGTKLHVDGFDASTNTIYEYHGCFWHGCPRCYPNRYETHQRHCARSMQDVYEDTKQRTQHLREQGYTVVEMWGCDWAHLKDTSLDISTFIANLQTTKPLNPRDAFCGGRTNTVKLYHQVTPNQKIHYIDVTSLYPWVNKTSVYPKGHPTFITHPGHTDIHQYFGLIQCQVLPPRELYHPVLPYRHDDKLLFPLCARCAEEEMAKPLLDRSYHCPHPDEERALTSTWCSPELVKAVELGYQVLYIYEVWHFPETCQWLFEDYVNTWLKIKQEASGWPEDNMTEEQKQDYIGNYLKYIKKNPGLRTLAKMMLNSMWGKFGQRLNKTRVQEFDDPQTFHRFLETDTLDIRHVSVINDQMVELHYQHQEEDIPVSPNLNIFVACFTTCHARIKLYETLQSLGERVLYYDTDSIIYCTDEGQTNPALGNYLGDFTNEINPVKIDGIVHEDYIVEFVSGGPKNYGYTTKNGKVECKVRGFRLNSEGKTQLNYRVMRQNFLDEIQKPLLKPRQTTVYNTHHIVRDPQTYQLSTYP